MSVQARELRIGNAIWDETKNKIKWVNHRVISDLASSAEPLPYSGIPLTPEILEKCPQLEKWKNSNTYSCERDGNVLQIHNNEIFLGGADSCTDGMGFFTEGKYLHQLQNAFILFGEELEYKP